MKKESRITTASGRYFLTDRIRDEINFQSTPQAQGMPRPPVEKTFPAGSRIIPLPGRDRWSIPFSNLEDAIAERQSHRHFTDEPLTLAELAFLLWATQGVRETLHPGAVLRTVPSAGCRHPFETYLAVLNVEGLESGLYRYLPLEHALVHMGEVDNLPAQLVAACRGQRFSGEASVTFLWSVLPERTEWRYGEASYKVIALDAGHLCQNLYLACAAIKAGTCAIAAYNQTLADELLAVDGEEEFTIYIAPVGKVSVSR